MENINIMEPIKIGVDDTYLNFEMNKIVTVNGIDYKILQMNYIPAIGKTEIHLWNKNEKPIKFLI